MAISFIFDCGATNLRTIVINELGQIVASHHLSNNTQRGAEHSEYHIWDIDEIWHKLTFCADRTLEKLQQQGIDLGEIVAIGVTTFGVDGAPFDANGKQLYPIISWKCPRTVPVIQNLAKYLNVETLYQRNGIGLYSFNTLFKLLWLKENKAEIFAKMDRWVFISSMLNHRLTGEWTTDRTMAGTSMLTNLQTNHWDQQVLSVLGLNETHFPPIKNAGEKIGNLSTLLCERWGLNAIPVISCGHDTQFSIFGSGAGLHQPILSSGTWEILMARTHQATPDFNLITKGLTTELDAQSQTYNPAVQWLGSGILEWVGRLLFADLVCDKDNYYQKMIKEGAAESAGCNGVFFAGDFNSSSQDLGKICGLNMQTRRGQVYRACLEYMALQLKTGLQILEQVSQFKAESIICVGGGSKNQLWNQIRADVLGLPLDVVEVAESTVLGAAMFVFAGVGVFKDVETAQKIMQPQKQRIKPSTDAAIYAELLQKKFKEHKC